VVLQPPPSCGGEVPGPGAPEPARGLQEVHRDRHARAQGLPGGRSRGSEEEPPDRQVGPRSR
jgi:hypothetical protein